MLDEKIISKITVENYDYVVSWELPYNDTSIDDFLQGFVSCLVGVTYNENSILEAMYEYAKDRLDIDKDSKDECDAIDE